MDYDKTISEAPSADLIFVVAFVSVLLVTYDLHKYDCSQGGNKDLNIEHK